MRSERTSQAGAGVLSPGLRPGQSSEQESAISNLALVCEEREQSRLEAKAGDNACTLVLLPRGRCLAVLRGRSGFNRDRRLP